MTKVSPEEEGIFYPRGLYKKDEVLFDQIDKLSDSAAFFSMDGDLQLLLGYQLIGVGRLDEAAETLRSALKDLDSISAASTLLEVLEKVRIEANENVTP